MRRNQTRREGTFGRVQIRTGLSSLCTISYLCKANINVLKYYKSVVPGVCNVILCSCTSSFEMIKVSGKGFDVLYDLDLLLLYLLSHQTHYVVGHVVHYHSVIFFQDLFSSSIKRLFLHILYIFCIHYLNNNQILLKTNLLTLFMKHSSHQLIQRKILIIS